MIFSAAFISVDATSRTMPAIGEEDDWQDLCAGMDNGGPPEPKKHKTEGVVNKHFPEQEVLISCLRNELQERLVLALRLALLLDTTFSNGRSWMLDAIVKRTEVELEYGRYRH